MLELKKISLDAETNGLWGKAFAIAAIAYDEKGEEVGRFIGRCPIEGEIDSFVKDNVLPQMTFIPENFVSYDDMLAAFFKWREAYRKDGFGELVHMGVPVEARLYMDARAASLIGDFDGPYPLVDISALPEIGTSVDGYNEKHQITPNPTEFIGGPHNPLYDVAATYAAYKHWMRQRQAYLNAEEEKARAKEMEKIAQTMAGHC